MENRDIRTRVQILKAQREGINAEMRALGDIPCFVCQFSGGIGVVEVKKEGENIAVDGQEWRICEACNGTGKACGEYINI